jgi:hypothetical protein
VPNLDVYAMSDDLESVLDAVFGAAAGLILIELDSRPDQPIRRFASVAEALEAIDLDADSANLGIHDRSLGDLIEERWIEFRPGAVPRATGRTTLDAWGLIQLSVPESGAQGSSGKRQIPRGQARDSRLVGLEQMF